MQTPFAIRPYHPSDLPMLYKICLLTGDSGADASTRYQDHELVGHYYAAPYAVLEPDLTFVLTYVGAPCGYVLGARDSQAFGERCEREWFPILRQRYALPDPDDKSLDAWIRRSIHAGYQPHEDCIDYPAHLHIDLLPIGQGQGWGRRLIQTLTDRLRALHIPAVHLGVGARNTRAIAFYEKMGFHKINAYEGWIAYGMRLA